VRLEMVVRLQAMSMNEESHPVVGDRQSALRGSRAGFQAVYRRGDQLMPDNSGAVAFNVELPSIWLGAEPVTAAISGGGECLES
jgi:hypothetical protein